MTRRPDSIRRLKQMLKVTAVSPTAPGLLDITWDDGVSRTVDVSKKLRGHVLLKMLNIPEVFRDVAVIHNGGGIGWVNGVDFCAQAIRLWSDEQMNEPLKVSA